MAEQCGAKTRGGGQCKKGAGQGTNHPGVGRCNNHGGSTPNHQRAAGLQMAVVMGAPMDIEPHDALLWCVRVAAGEVSYASAQVAALTHDQAVGPVVTHKEHQAQHDGVPVDLESTTRLAPELHIWIRARQDAVERLARFSKMALDAGVAERQVQLAERYGDLLARLLSGVLDELELTPGQRKRAPAIVGRHLQLLEGGATAAA